MFLKQAATLTALLYLLTLGLLHVATPTIARTCRVQSCERQSKLESRGYDAVKEPVQIDVGTCTEVYEESEDCNKPADNQVLLPQEGSGHQTEACPRRCEPRSFSRISTSNRDSPLSVNVIRSCYRTRHQCIQGCVVKPSYVYMFPGSKYQQRVNIGKCVGKCANSTLECVATRHRSIAIEGPNGYETVQKIEECSCKSTLCYRADHFQSFSELVTDYNNNTTTQKKRKEKLINVGKCVGSCPGVKTRGTCYPSDDDCLLYVGEMDAYCVPTLGEKYTFTDLNGNEKTVAAVVECGCGKG